MNRYLNLGIIQMPVSSSSKENIDYIVGAVDHMMGGYIKPELVIGVEYGLCRESAESIPGPITDVMSTLARKHGIYLIPGTMSEQSRDLPEGAFYNTCPVFAPDGRLLATYRKKMPFRPGEQCHPGESSDLCVFEIGEKGIRVGVLICYDQFFPEIPRGLALEGAEIIVCPSSDPMEFDFIPEIIPQARALENEAFYIWTSDAKSEKSFRNSCGSSTIVDPTGRIIYKCGNMPMTYVTTIDVDTVRMKREFGRDQHLKCLRQFGKKLPLLHNSGRPRVFETLGPLPENAADYQAMVRPVGLGSTK